MKRELVTASVQVVADLETLFSKAVDDGEQDLRFFMVKAPRVRYFCEWRRGGRVQTWSASSLQKLRVRVSRGVRHAFQQ